jgi:molybdate transport repressor ModE-like protein
MTQRRYYKELRLQQFRALVEVARLGTFSAAAQSLGLSRTSVWQQIRSLEDAFGAELVVVHGQQPEFTAAGRLLLELAGPLVDGFDGIKAAFQDRAGTLSRRLVVATTSSLLNHELRKPVALYRRKHPEVSISLIDRPSSAAQELLLRGRADVAVIGRIAQLALPPGLKAETLMHYPFVVACPKRHALARGTFRLSALLKHAVLCPSHGTNARARIDGVLAQAGLDGRIHFALDSHNAALLLAYVEQGLGVALTSMSPQLARRFKSKLALRDVSAHFGTEEIVLVERTRRFTLPHVDAFAQLVRGELRAK